MGHKKINYSLLIILFSAAIVIIYSCAAEGMPSGGPKDNTGPFIETTSPKDGALNVDRDISVEIEFSESVNYKSVENSLTVFPALEYSPKIKIKKNKVSVELKEKLDENKTYIFSFGRKIQDYQGNKTNGEVKIAFSTGSEMDQATISGQLFDFEESDKTAYVLLYNLVDIKQDSLINYYPAYYTSVNKNGYYQATNIAPGNYAMLAYLGSFKDYPRISEGDFSAVGFRKTITVNTKKDTLNHINFRLHQYPLLDFSYIKAFEEAGVMQLMFSHPININKTDSSKIFINGKSYSKQWWDNDETQTNLNLNLAGLDSGRYILEINGFQDSYDRRIHPTIDTIQWTNPAVIDTLGPRASISVNKSFPGHPEISLFFNEPVQPVENLSSRIAFFDADSKKVSFNIKHINLTRYDLIPKSPLPFYNEFTISALTDSIVDLYDNACQDSVIIKSFSTVNDDLFGMISGKVNTTFDRSRIMVGCRHLSEDYQYTTTVTKTGAFTLEKLMPGDYQMFVYFDANYNHQYDWGSLLPYNAAEKYKSYPQKITVRSRWETERVRLKF